MASCWPARPAPPVAPTDPADGLALRPRAIATLDKVLASASGTGLQTGCLVVQFDEADILLDRHGRAVQTAVLARAADRISTVLRRGDLIARLEGGSLAVILAPQQRLELETLVQVAARIQSAVAQPATLNGLRIYSSCSVGFCLDALAPEATGAALLDAAQIASDEAQRHGPGVMRGYSPDLPARHADRDSLRATLQLALDDSQIRPHFQPQTCTDTGEVSGVEALARWHHPTRGLLPPAEFLPLIEEAGLSERLAEIMLHHALAALSRWDRAGMRIPTVGVNFSAHDLRNSRLVEKIRWDLDRFDLTPDRLSIEILETVIAGSGDDIMTRNIAALSDLGCGIDLDDFGTGHASITTIRRFAVRRLKIDRSFVSHVDSDREQQRIVTAILSLAEQFDLDTLAEGVETPGEHAMLAQLGCRHVQGFGIGRPMGFEQVGDWLERHRNRQRQIPRIGQPHTG